MNNLTTLARLALPFGLAALLLTGCGRPDPEPTATVRAAITNGTTVSAGQNPATVAIYHQFPRPCSGTLLRPNWVLTARHCLTVDAYDASGPLRAVGDVRVAPPNVVTATNNGINPGLYPPSSAVTARRFVDLDVNLDLAMVELSGAIAPSSPPACNILQDSYCVATTVAPRALGLWNGETYDLLDREVILMGYGKSNMNGNESESGANNSGAGTLRMGPTTVTSTHTTFAQMHEGTGVPEAQSGDSGGPKYTTSDRFGRSLYGLASWHIGESLDGGSTAGFRNWIRRTMAFPGGMFGGSRPDVALVGGTGWNTFYWASSVGDGTFSYQTVTPGQSCPASSCPPLQMCPPHTCNNADMAAFATSAALPGVKPIGGDFNRDGRLDVLLVGGSGAVMRLASATGDGKIQLRSISSSGFAPLARATGARPIGGDFNGDGVTDVALAGGSGWSTIPVLWGKVGTTEVPFTNVSVADFPGFGQTSAQLVSGDFDGDGRDDLALAGGPGWGSVPLALSNGNGAFLPLNLPLADFPDWAQQSNVKVVAGDFNGDGRDDLALTGGVGWASIPVAFSRGDGGFWVTNEPLGNFPGYATEGQVKAFTGDFNGDGRDDIALAGGAGWGSVPVAFSNGDGTFRDTNGAAGTFAVQARNANATPVAVHGGGPPRPVHRTVEAVAARNANGRLEVFYTGTDMGIYRNRELVPGGGWSGEIAMGGLAKKLAVGQNQDGRLEIFYIGTDDHLWHTYQLTPNGAFSPDYPMGGATAQELAVGTNNDGRIEIFYARAGDGAFFHNYQNAPNSDWHGESSIGGSGKRLAVERDSNGAPALFCIGTDDAIYVNRQTGGGGWSGWSGLGGQAQELVVGRYQDGRLRIFYVPVFAGLEAGTIRSIAQAPGGAWGSNTLFSSRPFGYGVIRLAMGRTADHRLELLYVTGDGIVGDFFQPSWNAELTGPQGFDSRAKTRAVVVAASTVAGPMEMFFVGHNDAINRGRPSDGLGDRKPNDRPIADSLGAREVEAVLCATPNEFQSQTVTCPRGQVIGRVEFASYGTPNGPCGGDVNAFTRGSCDAVPSQLVVEAACIGKPSCTLTADNALFGDPCEAVFKRLYARLRCL